MISFWAGWLCGASLLFGILRHLHHKHISNNLGKALFVFGANAREVEGEPNTYECLVPFGRDQYEVRIKYNILPTSDGTGPQN